MALLGAGCSRDWDGLSVAADASPDSGSGGTSGEGGVGGQTCFPGSKVCPNAEGQPECRSNDDPDIGCGTPSCEPCSLPNATAKCDPAGECANRHVRQRISDCDGNPATGCEANVQFDPTQCGSCGNDCTTQGTGWICAQGSCTQNSCNPPTTGDCDGNAQNGCETDLLTDENCGFCNNACSASGTSCQNGQCVVSSCTSPYADCDGLAANGCETNVNTDAANCGSCGTKCGSVNGSAGCVKGNCILLCSSGWGDCDGNTQNGCETNLNTALSHCGACSTACTLAHVNSAQCNAGKCAYGSCAALYGDCDGNTANGCETTLASDPNNCGSCGKKCIGGSVCKLGACGSSCTGGLVNCGGTCVDLNSNATNCGSCGTVCTAPANGSPACASGSCGFSCNTSYSKCGSSCVKLQSDDNNCGACGMVCGTQTQCIGGTCIPI